MKLILASQGFTTPEIANAAAKLVGKPLDSLNVAIINEAYVGIDAGRDEKWLINELSYITKHVKGTIAFVNLSTYDPAEIRKRLEFADIIYIVGGKQLVLPKLFKETGFDQILKDLAQHKVIMGTSAGANVLGKPIEDANYWQDQYGSSKEFLANPFMGLVDFNILPHLGRPDHPHRTVERLTPLVKNNPFPLYAVTDKQAVIYDDDTINFAGGKPMMFGSPENNGS